MGKEGPVQPFSSPTVLIENSQNNKKLVLGMFAKVIINHSYQGEEALKLAQKVWKMMVQGNGYERILQQVTITAAGNGSCVAEFKVEKGMTNKGGTLHGGCTATLIDCISTIGLMTSKYQQPGVSVNLNVNYLTAAAEGAVIELGSKTVKSGKRLAFLEAVLKNKETGHTVATGSHVKFIGS